MESYKSISPLLKCNVVGMLLVVLCCPITSQSEIASRTKRCQTTAGTGGSASLSRTGWDPITNGASLESGTMVHTNKNCMFF